MGETKKFSIDNQNELEIKKIILTTYEALKEKGYNPISQIVGYILTEDPTYITTHNNARSLIRRVDRFELLQILLSDYLSSDIKKKEDL
ncbi:MAG: IreB family regulatory phosphoprotein [Oscillospiraceae bacterium]|nr:IreB family regulatory phosphoprotein [Oscillospiraceae bacterium]